MMCAKHFKADAK